jgi:hypothetical protein
MRVSMVAQEAADYGGDGTPRVADAGVVAKDALPDAVCEVDFVAKNVTVSRF